MGESQRLFEEQDFLSVKQISDIVGISRQTLIYYDSIDLFKPAYVGKNGYRKYSVAQIMELREIISLKAMGISLSMIRDNIQNKTIHTKKKLLDDSLRNLEAEIEQLEQKIVKLNNSRRLMEKVQAEAQTVSVPQFRCLPDRFLFIAFSREDVGLDRGELYRTFMEGRKILYAEGVTDDLGWGGYFPDYRNLVKKGEWSRGFGVYIYITEMDAARLRSRYADHIVMLPKGNFLCGNEFGMPYEHKLIENLLDWGIRHRFELDGPVLVECLLDITYDGTSENMTDFSQFQIRIQS